MVEEGVGGGGYWGKRIVVDGDAGVATGELVRRVNGMVADGAQVC